MNPKMKATFKILRRTLPASKAFTRAKEWIEAGKLPHCTRGIEYNPEFDGNKRFVENPEAGLRLVGYADEVYKHIGHTGWFSTVDGWSGETIRGIVYQLPSKKGFTCFVGGYEDPDNNAAILDFGELFEDAEEAARHGDSMAETTAEEERERDHGWTLGGEYEQAQEQARESRKSALDLIRELKANKSEYTPAICSAIRAQLSGYVDSWRENKAAMSRIVKDNYWGENELAGFNDRTGLNIKF